MARTPHGFTAFSTGISHAAGRPAAFMLALSTIIVWALVGPFVAFSEKWQLIINTGTTIVTFLMVFLLQNTQNRDIMALHAKLDELILASQATNRLIGVEKLSDKEIKKMSEELSAEAIALAQGGEGTLPTVAGQDPSQGPDADGSSLSAVESRAVPAVGT